MLTSDLLVSLFTLPVTYLIAHPVKQAPRIHRMRHTFAKYWKKHKRPLDIGHRGLGDSYKMKEEL